MGRSELSPSKLTVLPPGHISVNQLYAHIASRSTHPPLPSYHPTPHSLPPLLPSSTLPPLLPWPLSGSPRTSASSPALPWLLLVVKELLVVVASAVAGQGRRMMARPTASIPACVCSCSWLLSSSAPPFRPAGPAGWWRPSLSLCCARGRVRWVRCG